jgi:uncharacterized repeat protein (TIGR01451 family)
MKLQPCSPGFVDGRDAILAADMALTSGANQCEIWTGFAKRGSGFSADQGSSGSRFDGTEAFDMPAFCSEADAVITGSDSPDPVNVGSPLTYEFVVNNMGVITATNVVLTDVLDAGTDYVSATPSQGSCSLVSGDVICNLNSLDPGDSVTVTVVTTAMVAGSVSNTATVAITESENTANNSVTVVTTVEEDEYKVYMPVMLKN